MLALCVVMDIVMRPNNDQRSLCCVIAEEIEHYAPYLWQDNDFSSISRVVPTSTVLHTSLFFGEGEETAFIRPEISIWLIVTFLKFHNKEFNFYHTRNHFVKLAALNSRV